MAVLPDRATRVAAAATAIKIHSDAVGAKGHAALRARLLLVSLRDWCEEHGVDFDEAVLAARDVRDLQRFSERPSRG